MSGPGPWDQNPQPYGEGRHVWEDPATYPFRELPFLEGHEINARQARNHQEYVAERMHHFLAEQAYRQQDMAIHESFAQELPLSHRFYDYDLEADDDYDGEQHQGSYDDDGLENLQVEPGHTHAWRLRPIVGRLNWINGVIDQQTFEMNGTRASVEHNERSLSLVQEVLDHYSNSEDSTVPTAREQWYQAERQRLLSEIEDAKSRLIIGQKAVSTLTSIKSVPAFYARQYTN